MDKKIFDEETGKKIVINPKDTKNLIKKIIIHDKCKKKHIDEGKFATFNHRKHLCLYCDEYFYDNDRAVGV